jgi:antitoxin HicB
LCDFAVSDIMLIMRRQPKLQFNIMFRPEPEGGFTATVPSLPGCITYGKDLNTAKEMIIDAIRGYIASIKKHKEPLITDEDSFISLIKLPERKSDTYA